MFVLLDIIGFLLGSACLQHWCVLLFFGATCLLGPFWFAFYCCFMYRFCFTVLVVYRSPLFSHLQTFPCSSYECVVVVSSYSLSGLLYILHFAILVCVCIISFIFNLDFFSWLISWFCFSYVNIIYSSVFCELPLSLLLSQRSPCCLMKLACVS